ncbi:MAG: arginase family protein [Candidatus Bathyarchaeia archaeon]|nr:arginase family protein [Candidatus Bathyarchaeota archaeon]
MRNHKKIKVFGVAFDPDEYIGAIERQYYLALLKSGIDYIKEISDPYDLMMPYICEIYKPNTVIKLGKVPVESWLSPKPELDDEVLVNTENYSAFIDANGCREYVDLVKDFVQKITDENTVPLMIGIDHSMTGGMLKALSEIYGVENISVIILDSHFDAIQTSARYKLFTFLKRKNSPLFYPDSFYLSTSLYDPLAFKRPDSYNKGTFLYYLIKERTILPTNLWVVGVQDYPVEDLLAQKDSLIQSYVNAYLNLENEGVNIVTNEIVKSKTFKSVIEKLSTKFVYISLDVDIGCGSAITLTRCLPHERGLSEPELYRLARTIGKIIKGDKKFLVGLDVMELDIHYFKPGDKTPTIVANILKYFWGDKS